VGRRKNPGGEYRHQGGEFGISVDLAMECALCAGLNSQDLYGWIWLHLWRDWGGIVFQTASPFDTPRLMTQLVEWISETLARRTLHPLVAIAVFIVLFLQIHPFQDGNGRLSRALTTLLLLRAGYAYVPYSSLESVIEQSKDAYYLALRRTQKTTRTRKPDWQPWVLFFLRALQKQKQRLEIKVDREKKILGQLPELSLRIFELAKDRGQIKVEDVLRVTGAPRGTVKDHLTILIKSGYLLQHGKGKGTWYSVG